MPLPFPPPHVLSLLTLLQVHQEVFQYLIEDFKTYKPLLSAIKNEYELFIAHEQQVIKQLEPLKVCLRGGRLMIFKSHGVVLFVQSQLEAVKEECERRIVALRENDKNGKNSVLLKE